MTDKPIAPDSISPLSSLLLQIAAVERAATTGASAAEQRQHLAATIEALIATLARLPTAPPEGPQRQALNDLLQRMHAWAANGRADDEQAAKQLFTDLHAMTGVDPAAADREADARRRAELHANVDKSIGEIFGKLKFKL